MEESKNKAAKLITEEFARQEEMREVVRERLESAIHYHSDLIEELQTRVHALTVMLWTLVALILVLTLFAGKVL